jgi:hypothetical protein
MRNIFIATALCILCSCGNHYVLRQYGLKEDVLAEKADIAKIDTLIDEDGTVMKQVWLRVEK